MLGLRSLALSDIPLSLALLRRPLVYSRAAGGSLALCALFARSCSMARFHPPSGILVADGAALCRTARRCRLFPFLCARRVGIACCHDFMGCGFVEHSGGGWWLRRSRPVSVDAIVHFGFFMHVLCSCHAGGRVKSGHTGWEPCCGCASRVSNSSRRAVTKLAMSGRDEGASAGLGLGSWAPTQFVTC